MDYKKYTKINKIKTKKTFGEKKLDTLSKRHNLGFSVMNDIQNMIWEIEDYYNKKVK